ncbi:ABC transporter substrate-binding protein [Acidaminobacter sp. JC074]|uniref:ABC transporter substrate-binding protein n=1 Tax=Acidaminobacter sp. JC074 TaxID=2530199 RepID=UPI001F0E9D38|nr:ABC transporter substrate-binding protein [Acidaminobacter sp. JC074]MCH4887333.1 ABC transporter substrate-binding protein [Acidaminobacter sp. JC074]
MKKLISLLLVMMMVFAFVGCGANEANETNTVENTEVAETTEEVAETEEATEEVEDVVESYYPVSLTDGMGREVTIESEPMTVVSLAPSMTELVYALGLGDRLVGRTDYCNFPEAALEVDSIGSLREPNLEAIIALNPDLVLMSTHASEEVLAKLDEAGLTVAILFAQENFDGAYEIIDQAGMIFNVEENATALVDTMKADVAAVLEAVKDVEKKTVYYVVGFGEWGDYTATGDTFIHEMLEMAGGTNIAADGEGWSYNLESIILADPEYVICSQVGDTKTILSETEGYMELTAVKDGKLVEINQDLLSRQGPRLAEGLKAIAELLHPELFQ